MTITREHSKSESSVGVEQWVRMYRRMLMIRLFEEQVNELYTRALMPGLAHLYVGQEAVAVGICEGLRPDDYITLITGTNDFRRGNILDIFDSGFVP